MGAFGGRPGEFAQSGRLWLVDRGVGRLVAQQFRIIAVQVCFLVHVWAFVV